MSITSLSFILFAAVLCLCYFLLPKKLQWVVLLAGSLYFYCNAGVQGLVYILLTATSAYAGALALSGLSKRQKAFLKANKDKLSKEEKAALKQSHKRNRRLLLTAVLVLNFGLLCFFKYFHFALEQLNALLGLAGLSQIEDSFRFLMPLGISFYTFQTMGYVVDVYWEKSEPQRNWAKLLLFVSFFPQILQGPIHSYKHLQAELFTGHSFSYDRFVSGIQRMLWGFFKKLVIADMLAPFVNAVFANYESYVGVAVALGALFYAVQIYADFSGYMDIVCGLCEILGIRLVENFDCPYFSKSIAEYWRRWHISLGEWFKTYLYYPVAVSSWAKNLGKKGLKRLGASFGKTIPATLALVLVWFTTGFWHGASWSYIAWGGINGAFIIVSLWLEPVYTRVNAKLRLTDSNRLWQLFRILRTFCLVTFIKVLPEVGTLSDGIGLWKQVFTSRIIPDRWIDWFPYGANEIHITVVAVGFLMMLIVDGIKMRQPPRQWLNRRPFLVRFVIYFVLIATILVFGCYGKGYDPQDFMYFKF